MRASTRQMPLSAIQTLYEFMFCLLFVCCLGSSTVSVVIIIIITIITIITIIIIIVVIVYICICFCKL
jgi:hypothetical protein